MTAAREGGGGCVGAAGLGERRAVCDSTDPDGPAFVFSKASWAAFIAAVQRGELDRPER